MLMIDHNQYYQRWQCYGTLSRGTSGVAELVKRTNHVGGVGRGWAGQVGRGWALAPQVGAGSAPQGRLGRGTGCWSCCRCWCDGMVI